MSLKLKQQLNLGRRSLEEKLNNKEIQFWPKWSILQINRCWLLTGVKAKTSQGHQSEITPLSAFKLCILSALHFARNNLVCTSNGQTLEKRSRHDSTTAPQLARPAPSGHKITSQKQLILIFMFLNKMYLIHLTL